MHRRPLLFEVYHSYQHVLQVSESRQSSESVQKLVKLIGMAKVYNTINDRLMSSCWAISSLSHMHTRSII
jgi:hypothetical protein